LIINGVLIALLNSCTASRSGIVFDHGIPFPREAINHHIYIVQPNSGYHDYVVYVRSDVSSEAGEAFLDKLGFGANELGLPTVLPCRDLPNEIVEWWTPPRNAVKIRSKTLGRYGYAQAILSEGQLYIYMIGDYRLLAP